MEQVAPILKAIASLLWTGFAFMVLFLFKSEIREAIQRLAKVEILGQKIELRDKLVELQASAVATEKEVQELPRHFILDAEPGQYLMRGGSATTRVDQEETFDATVKSILQQATSDPKLALMAVAAELEKQARQALATRGLLGDRQAVSLSHAFE